LSQQADQHAARGGRAGLAEPCRGLEILQENGETFAIRKIAEIAQSGRFGGLAFEVRDRRRGPGVR